MVRCIRAKVQYSEFEVRTGPSGVALPSDAVPFFFDPPLGGLLFTPCEIEAVIYILIIIMQTLLMEVREQECSSHVTG